MNDPFDPEAMRAKSAVLTKKLEASIEPAYQRWLASPEIKLMVSLIPTSQPPELVQTILLSAFRGGFNHGLVSLVTETMGMLPFKPE